MICVIVVQELSADLYVVDRHNIYGPYDRILGISRDKQTLVLIDPRVINGHRCIGYPNLRDLLVYNQVAILILVCHSDA